MSETWYGGLRTAADLVARILKSRFGRFSGWPCFLGVYVHCREQSEERIRDLFLYLCMYSTISPTGISH